MAVPAAAPLAAAPSAEPPPAGPPLREPAPAAAGVAALHTNPVPLLDPALGLVVLEFFNDAGAVTQSIPTQKQLDLYRLNLAAPSAGPPPDWVSLP